MYGPLSCPVNKGYYLVDVQSPGVHLSHVHPDVLSLSLSLSPMVSTRALDVRPLRRLQPSTSSHDRYRYSPATPKLHCEDGVDHDHLEAYVSCPQGDEYSAYALPERTQGKSHPQRTVNTQDDLSLSHMHCPVGQATHEHLDAFLTQQNLHTNDDAILCRYGGLPPWSIENFDTFVKRFSAQYATSWSHRMTSVTLASLQQAEDGFLQKFMYSLRTICAKKPSSMDELHEQAKSYIQMEKMLRFKNKVQQARQNCDKKEGNTKTISHKLDKRHKPNKCKPLPKGPRYECYTPLTANYTTILEEACNLEVPIRLPPMKLPGREAKQPPSRSKTWRTPRGLTQESRHGQKQEPKFSYGGQSNQSRNVTPYPPTREPAKPNPTTAKALTVYQASLDDKFDVDPCDNTSDRGLKPIEELVKLQHRPKPGQPWIFFINGVLSFLKINGNGMEKEKDDWRCHFKEKMSQEEAHHHRKPWIRA
ncbi:hypothetical protein HKD37_01G000727 [Glycine soja]